MTRYLTSIAFAVLLPGLALAESGPLTFEEARGLIGSAVLTADDVALGKLVALQPGAPGAPVFIVLLNRDFRVQTSALVVDGLRAGVDGKLRLPDDRETLVSRMALPLPETE